MKKCLLITLLIIFTHFNIFSQEDFHSGYIIKNDHDTLYGFIRDKGKKQNAKACYFKKNGGSEEEVYFPKDLVAYRMTDRSYYISKMIELEDGFQVIFLEFLLQGIYNLYYANYLDKELYYLGNNEGELILLTDEEADQYKEVLKESFSDYPELFLKIEKSDLNHNSLVYLTKEYHKNICDDFECVTYVKAGGQIDFSIGPSFGLSSLEINYNLNEEVPSEPDKYISNYGINYYFGIKTLLEFPMRDKRFTQEFSVKYSKLYFNKHEVANSDHIDFYVYMNHLQLKIAPRYALVDSKIRVSIQGGILLNILNSLEGRRITESVQDNIHITEVEPVIITAKPFQIGFAAGIGIDYNIGKKIVFLDFSFEFTEVETAINLHTVSLKGWSLNTGILF